jgi:hypothetical protein
LTTSVNLVCREPMSDHADDNESTPRITQDPASWQAGYNAGMSGHVPHRTPPEVADGLAYWAGVIEGKAARLRAAEARRSESDKEP